MNKTSVYYKYEDISKSRYPNASLVDDILKQGTSTLKKVEDSFTQNLDNGSNPGRKVIPTRVENKSTLAANLANSDGRRNIFVTKYSTGFKPTKSVLQSAKENGVGVKVISDSKIDFRGDNSLFRNALTQGQGFNQVEYHVPPNVSQITNTQLRQLIYNDNTSPLDENKETDVRSLVMNLKQQFIIKNQATHLPLIFKIHIVKLLESPTIEEDLGQTFLKSFYSGGELDTAFTRPGKIPIWYQAGATFSENTTFIKNASYNVTTSTKLKSLRKASLNFRTTFEIVETFSHTIKPGDFWNFSHTHNCGTGIDREFLQQFNSPGTQVIPELKYAVENLPYTYGIIFETKGKLCEAQVIEASNSDSLAEYNTYLGTSPGQYMYEFKTTMNYVRDPENKDTVKAIINTTDETTNDILNAQILTLTELRLPRTGWRENYPQAIEEYIGQYVIPFTSRSFETIGGITGPNEDIVFQP